MRWQPLQLLMTATSQQSAAIASIAMPVAGHRPHGDVPIACRFITAIGSANVHIGKLTGRVAKS